MDDSTRWDEIVKSFSNADVYYLSGYVKAFKIHGDGEPILYYYQDENIRAINVVMKRDIAEDKKFSESIPKDHFFDISTPYGYGGFIIEGEPNSSSLDALNKQYIQINQENNIISEFVRFHPGINNAEYLEHMYDTSKLGSTVTMNLDSPEQIWNDIASKNRNVIRKAKKSGVEIYWGRSSDLVTDFIPLYNQTMKHDEASSYYYFNEDFYNSILNDLKYNSMFFYAEYDNKIISIAIILFDNKSMHYHLSASDFNFRHLAATNLLLNEVANWGSINGFSTFHLGGGLGSKEDSLFSFKKKFNKNSNTTFSIGKKIFDEDIYNQLLNYRSGSEDLDNESSYFPKYRA